MKELPIVKTDSTPLFDMQYGMLKALSLMNAVEMGIFNHLGEEKNAGEAAAALGTHEANTELFLNTLCSLGLLVSDEGPPENALSSLTRAMKNLSCTGVSQRIGDELARLPGVQRMPQDAGPGRCPRDGLYCGPSKKSRYAWHCV